MTKEIQLARRGKVAMVDDEDYEWLAQWRWSYMAGYAYRKEHDKLIFMHSLIVPHSSGQCTHHINEIPFDNRRLNLIALSLSDHHKIHGRLRWRLRDRDLWLG